MRQVDASRLTPAGQAWLERGGPIKLLHVFEAVCNLINSDGVVLSVQFEAVPASPVSLSLPDSFLSGGENGFVDVFDAGAEVTISTGSLRLGELTVAWQGARQWDPTPAWPVLRAAQADWQPRLASLVPLLIHEAPANSLAPLLAPTADVSEEIEGGLIADKILGRARQAAADLQAALRQEDRPAARQPATALAGLGGGLTPSGDDYLIGVMHALWATRPAAEAEAWSELLYQQTIDRTGPLSTTWLNAAAHGQATGSWHQLLADLLSGSESELRATTRRIMAIGHSSGADGLTGFTQTLL